MNRSGSKPTSRRALLAALATAGVGALAGCSAGEGVAGGESTPPPTATPTRTPEELRSEFAGVNDGTPIPVEERDQLGEWGLPTTICEAEIIEDTDIRAIVDPVYDDDWTGVRIDEKYKLGFAGEGLSDDTYVIGVTSEDGTRARAYPLSVVWWHEIVNDVLDRPLLVTFCPICQSGMVAERLVAGEETVFGVSGQLWQAPRIYAETAKTDGRVFGASATDGKAEARNSGNLVLYDELTESFWSQILAQAICGEREGDRLTIAASTVARWKEWRADHPDTDVLLPPPHSTVM
jgi:hypothetical protein